MKQIDILTKDKLYGEMLFCELKNAGYTPSLGRSKKADLIIVDIDNTEIFSTEIPIITYSEQKEASLTKPFLITELLRNIAEYSALPATEKDKKVRLLSGRCYYGDESVELSKLEYNLLDFILSKRGSVVCVQDIARDVFGTDNANAVRVYIHYLRKKLDEKFSRKIIYSVHGKGYMIK